MVFAGGDPKGYMESGCSEYRPILNCKITIWILSLVVVMWMVPPRRQQGLKDAFVSM